MSSGNLLDDIIGTCLSGFIASSSFGWSGIFYVFGLSGIISAVLMAVYVVDSPQVHPTISPEEKAFIAKSFRKVKNYTELKVMRCEKLCDKIVEYGVDFSRGKYRGRKY